MTTNVHQIIPEAQSFATLVTVTESQTLQDALSLMIEHDFSQLPVIDTTGKLQGLISSDSILKAISYFKAQLDTIYVSNAMLDPVVCRADDDIAELLSLLKESDAVLVVGKGNRLIGILTSYDTTEYYLRQAENFMLVKEIESLVCEYIQHIYKDDTSLSAAVSKILSPSISNGDAKKFLNKYLREKNISGEFDDSAYRKVYRECFVAPVKDFSDLTLHQYIQLLSEIWSNHQQTFYNLEWSAIRNLLEDVKKIRNSIAHFREVTPLEQKKLYFGAQLLNRYRPEDKSLYSQELSIPIPATSQSEAESTAPFEEIDENSDIYEALSSYLQKIPEAERWNIQMTFKEIEGIIEDSLPTSAQKHRSWWSNDPKAQIHSQSWLDVGWRVSNVNIGYQKVSFKRIDSRQQRYINFFSILGEKLKGVQEFSGLKYRLMNNQGRHWYTLEITNNETKKLTWISISFATRSRLRLEMHMSKEEYISSYSKKEEIELLFGEPLSWEPLDGKQGSRVAVYKDKTNIMMDETVHHDAEEWIIKKIGRFYTSIAPSLQTNITPNVTNKI